MTTHHYPCDLCGQASGDDARVCLSCADRAADALQVVAEWLGEDLETVAVARQTALGTGRSGGKPTKASEAPLPLDLRASEAASVLRSTLVGWVRVLQEDGATGTPNNTLGSMAAWLAPLCRWVRSAEYGPEFADEIGAAVAQALRAVDRPTRRVPLPGATCRVITLVGQTPRACDGLLYAVIAPGLATDGQVRCEEDRTHTTTVEAVEAAGRKAARIRARLAPT